MVRGALAQTTLKQDLVMIPTIVESPPTHQANRSRAPQPALQAGRLAHGALAQTAPKPEQLSTPTIVERQPTNLPPLSHALQLIQPQQQLQILPLALQIGVVRHGILLLVLFFRKLEPAQI